MSMFIMPTGSYSEMQKPTRIIVFDARNPGSDALEPCEAKVSSTVLGGVGGSNPSRLLDPYIASVKKNTRADIAFDKFHIIKKVNEVLDKVRKSVFAQSDKSTRKEMMHKRFLILHRRKNLIEEEDIESLEQLLESNKPLYTAYILKEEIADIFDDVDESRETVRLEQWFKNVSDSGIMEFLPVVSMIQSYLYGVLNYFKHRLTNAGSEGFNNKINIIKRAAFGFRDIEYFKLKIFQRCGGI